ncbi:MULTISPECIES: glycosyltransferase [unclassified Amycolatopsis]|uniref:glycosyltransferase n=1 Tax=unclassified Amycolatopsis TaxID=2618356 RepID=UPI002874E474|nr:MULTISPECIES: glycosyltransferase [unclassified Amycolatopsis]MDS0134561.1 glycosyltransferase [Amycolatopsis sp. 505]MDS0147540.1 glycosyltransferase [Amycolatopsis sp. CM201R]
MIIHDTAPADALTALRDLRPGTDLTRVDEVRRGFHPAFGVPALVEYAGAGPAAGDADSALAELRALARASDPPSPADVLAALPETEGVLADLGTSVALDLFSAATAAHGWVAAGVAIRAAFGTASPRRRVLLLDLAERHDVGGIPAGAVVEGAEHDRALRHAGWRYLSRHSGAITRERDEDPYERALAAVCRATPADAPLWTVPPARREGLVVAQSMLLGSFDQPGAGASGGLTVLLRHLGTALPQHDGIARVVTLTPAGHDDLAGRPALAEADGDGHVVLRIPVDAPTAPAQPELSRHRAALTFLARRLLRLSGCHPDVVHVRYADDGSLAIADAATALGARTVFTLTADPHRSLAERHRPASAESPASARFDLHRVYAADRLVARADTLLGLPGRPPGELPAYFPALRGRPEPESLAEGIPVLPQVAAEDPRQQQLADSLFAPDDRLPRLGPDARGLPIVLSVGRLHPVKQQDLLVEAWLTRGLHRRTALVLVGGDPARPTEDETRVLERILALHRAYPRAAGRLAVLAALGNDDVRLLEHGLTRLLPAPSPHLYACPSRKEEFGIAVLEAMEAGLLVLGPRRGGLRHYIDHGHNGLLADTSGLDAFGDDLSAFVRAAADDPARARAAAAAGRDTVRRRFGITQVAARFADVYRRTSRTPRRPAS